MARRTGKKNRLDRAGIFSYRIFRELRWRNRGIRRARSTEFFLGGAPPITTGFLAWRRVIEPTPGRGGRVTCPDCPKLTTPTPSFS